MIARLPFRWPSRWHVVRLLEPWRTRVLWASVGLNLFAVALFAAPLLWHRRPMRPPGFDSIIERMAHGLPPPDAEAFRDAMARERPWYDLSRGRLDEARAEIAHQIAHEPFDPAATRAAMAAMQDRLRESSVRFDDSLLAALAALSPQARAHLADSLRRRP